MMKKLFAALLSLMIAAAACAMACAEDEEWIDFPDRYPGARAFESYWVSGDAQVRIDAFCRLDGFEMNIVWMTGEHTFTAWEYIMTYDEETGRLVCSGTGMMTENTIDDAGEITRCDTVYEDGTASFWLNEDGDLNWDDEKESTFSATVFHRIGRFPGTYTGHDITVNVRYAGEDLLYDVNLEHGDGTSVGWNWNSMTGIYDPETDTLPVEGSRVFYTWLEEGKLDLDADLMETEVKAVFRVDGEGRLVCASDDSTIDGLVFDPVLTPMWQWEF